MAIFIEKYIIRQSPAVNNMLSLLCYICFMRLKVKLISPTTKFIRGMILQTDTAKLSRTIIRT